MKKYFRQFLPLLLICFLLSSCGGTAKGDWSRDFAPADFSGYACAADYEKDWQFVDLTVRDADKLIREGASFAVMTSFADCPWCNAVLPYVNDAAIEAGATVASIDTRKDPSWTSNLDLADYDLFVEHFGTYLTKDENDLPHLYVPHIFFIRDGEVVYEHFGALPEMGNDPHMELNGEQKEALREIFREGFRLMK